MITPSTPASLSLANSASPKFWYREISTRKVNRSRSGIYLPVSGTGVSGSGLGASGVGAGVEAGVRSDRPLVELSVIVPDQA